MQGLRFFSASVFSGVSLWLVIAVLSGRKEAWDSGLYWSVGLLATVLIGIAVGRYTRIPARFWWLGFALGQSAMLVSSGGSANLWPLSIVAMLLVTSPVAAAIWLTRAIRARRAAGLETP